MNQPQALLEESQYQESIAFLAHEKLRAQKAMAQYAAHSQRLEAANQSLSQQLKDAQEKVAELEKKLAQPPVKKAATKAPKKPLAAKPPLKEGNPLPPIVPPVPASAAEPEPEPVPA